MGAIYPYAQFIHLICAVIFVGYLFFDVVIFKMALKKVDNQTGEKMKKAISSTETRIISIFVLLLLLSGGMMMSHWVGSKAGGYFSSNLQIFFMIKVLLAFIVFIAVGVKLTYKLILKRPSPNIHPLALLLSFVIIYLAIFFKYAG